MDRWGVFACEELALTVVSGGMKTMPDALERHVDEVRMLLHLGQKEKK